MEVICDEEGQWWVAFEDGEPIAGPFFTEERAWRAFDDLADNS